ncbi:hypothetical protein GW17_00055662, partial [Ensete ventricosum]
EPAIAISRSFLVAAAPLPIAKPHIVAFHPIGHIASVPVGPLLSATGSDLLNCLLPLLHSFHGRMSRVVAVVRRKPSTWPRLDENDQPLLPLADVTSGSCNLLRPLPAASSSAA